MVCSEELLIVEMAFPEIVDIQVNDTIFPTGVGNIFEFGSTVAADVYGRFVICRDCELGIWIVRFVRGGGAGVKGALVVAGQYSTGPGLTMEVKRILMALDFVFALVFVVAELAVIRLFGLVGSRIWRSERGWWSRDILPYLNSSSVSNCFGFLGQHVHVRKKAEPW